MNHPANEGFTDNWAYLKTELTWLDRMLMMAVARYRQEKKSVDRVAQSQADQVSSHWWKGVISLDGNIAYDEHRPSAPINGNKPHKAGGNHQQVNGQSVQPQPKIGYQQQLEMRIQASKRGGITLALPWLCDRLKLSLFEKNLLLMGLAPEVNRRYARLYRYLQSHDDHLVTDLPSVELVLRLLCRNDQEWRRARQKLSPGAPLITHNLVLLLYQSHDPFLNATIRLVDELVDCLLAEKPDPHDLEALLTAEEAARIDPQLWSAPPLLPIDFSNQLSVETAAPTSLTHSNSATSDLTVQPDASTTNEDEDAEAMAGSSIRADTAIAPIVEMTHGSTGRSSKHDADEASNHEPSDGMTDIENQQWAPTWTDLVLPPDLMQGLQHLTHRFGLYNTVNQYWSAQSPKMGSVNPGSVLLFTGPKGTGKSMAANVLAHDISDSLTCVNLAEIMQADDLMVIDEVEATSASVVLIQSAERWLRSSSSLPSERLVQFLTQRRQGQSLTILSVEQVEAVAYRWRQQMDHLFQFPMPDSNARQTLWRQSFPPKLKLGRTINWAVLSQIPLSGGEIGSIAHDAMIRMVAEQAKTLKLQYLVAALQWHHVPDRHIQPLQNAARSSRNRKPHRHSSAKSAGGSITKSKSSPRNASSSPATVNDSPNPTGVLEPSQHSSALPKSTTSAAPNQTHLQQSQSDEMIVADHHVDANV